MPLILKSIDTMKITRDTNAVTNEQKIEHINRIAELIPDLTHITVASYQNNYGYQSVAYIKEWFDAVHATGKKVFFRPAFAAAVTSPADFTQKIVNSAVALQSCFANGDAWDVVPESYPQSSVFGGLAGWNQWIRDTIIALNAHFATIGKTVDCTFWSTTDQTAVFNARIEAATVTAMGNKICIDFYPMDLGSMRGKIQSFYSQIALARTNYPTADIYVTEIGYNNMLGATDEDQRNLLRHFYNELSNISYVKGVNYWHGYGNAAYDKCLLFESLSRTKPRPALYSLSEYFKRGHCSDRQRILP